MNTKIYTVLLTIAVIVSLCALYMPVWDNVGFRTRFSSASETIKNRANATVASYRRFSTADEMRYILYGHGDEFSPYSKHVLDYIRAHITRPSSNRPRRLTRPHVSDTSQVGIALLGL